VLADEPTGNLDSKTGAEIMALFGRLHDQGHTMVLITHDRDVATMARRVINIRDGRIERDERVR
jgi:putative ABC transport system ATP-binding protein